MGKDFESWFHQRQLEGQFPNAQSPKLPFDLRTPNAGIPCAIPCTNEAPMSGTFPSYGLYEQPNFKGGVLKEHHGWFNCLPQLRQGFIPDTTLLGKLTSETDFPGKVPNGNHGVANVSATDPRYAPKQFLVFDQTGDQTTLILSSMIGTPNQPLNSLNRKKSTGYYNASGGELENRSTGLLSEPNLTEELDDENMISEMHEDSDDIDALLSSDEEEDKFTDDGEETSTGHSPSTMTAYEKHHWFDDTEDMDEVASSAGPSKRQKLSDISYEVPSITYTSSSPKPKGSSEYADDAESSCAGGAPTRYATMCSLSGIKRERKEKIRETVSVLQTILPDGNGKDAVVVLDEAINYLKSLRFKAKSLGISGYH